MANFGKTFEELLLKLGLDSKDFQTEHTKVTNRAVQEATAVVNVYENLKRTFSEIPKGSLKQFYRQFQLGQRVGTPFSEEGGVVSYAGTPLISKRGTPYRSSAKIVEASTGIYRGLAKEVVRAKEEAISTVKVLPGKAFKEEKEKLDIDFGMRKYTGMTSQQYNKAIAGLGKEYKLTNEEQIKLMKSGDGLSHTMGKIFKRAVETVPVWMAIRGSIQFLTKTISEGIKFWAEFETAMTQVKIVGMGTEEEYKQLGNEILGFSVKYGTAIKEVTEAAKLFAQQGLSIREVTTMTNAATLGALVLEENVGIVAENLTAAVRAYNIPMEDSLLIIDKWMKVQKDFAISAKELADGMKTAGSTASAFGITIDQFAGHLTAIVETTRKTGSQAANALQMIYTRLFSTASNAIQEIAQVPIYQTEAGQAVMETTHIFRESGDVIDDIAIKWKTLTNEQKINLAVQIGSRRQAAPFIALMENYDRALKAQIESLNASGSAMEAYNLISDTVNFKIQQMNNTWLTLANTFEQTTPWKKAIDLVKGLGDAFLYLIDARAAYLKLDIESKQQGIDDLTIKKNQLSALKELYELEEKQSKNPDKAYREQISEARIKLEKLLPEIKKEDIDKQIDKMNLDLISKEIDKTLQAEFTKLGLAGQKHLLGNVFEKGIEKYLEDAPLINELTVKYKMTTKTLLQEIDRASKEIEGKGGYDKVRKELLEKREKLLAESEAKYIASKKPPLTTDEEQLRLEAEELKTAKELKAELNHQVALMQIKGKTEKETLEYQIQQIETNKKLTLTDEKRTELLELRYKLEQATTRELYEQANAIEKTLSGSIKNIMSGTSGLGSIFTDLNKTIVESYRTIVSDEMAKGLMDTGIGEIFGRSMLGLKGQIEKGHESVYKWIVKGHQDAMSGKVSSQAGMTGLGGRLSALPGFGKGGWFSQPINSENYGVSGGRIGPPRSQSLTRGDLLAGGAQGLLTGYAAYQSGVSGGLSKGMAGASAGLTGIGSMLSMTPFAPLGWGLTALGTILQIFGKKKQEQAQVETKTSENKISSKIDVTNKTLEILNRNLIGLRQDMRTAYILPQSSYFSEKDSLEAEFSLSSRRGLA